MGCQGLREGVRLWQAEVGLRAKGCQNAAVPELRHDGCRQQKKRHEDSRKRSGRDERGHDDRRWLLKEYAEDDRRLQEGRDHGKTFEIKTEDATTVGLWGMYRQVRGSLPGAGAGQQLGAAEDAGDVQKLRPGISLPSMWTAGATSPMVWPEAQKAAFRAICDFVTGQRHWDNEEAVIEGILCKLGEHPLYFGEEEEEIIANVQANISLLWEDDPKDSWE
ncbi:hypothetical protein AK812_SmicGene30145 [Symbiodinium microadriaticum]|uniref:Uncharacterized protein n=1 Tax=Symbiodinium microadriaticum TaxID=2951 RepID=A0A1Q9D028_SYMMI|nr:hypothetical protein AK812_SmicGene30145 [Symbiodinium microadriaticum]